MVTRSVLSDGSLELSSPECRLRVMRLKPGVVLIVQTGNDDEVTRALFAEFTAEIKSAGALTVFADVRGIQRMSSEIRDYSLSWGRRNRDEIRHATILVGSKVVDMAMSILAMLLGGGLIKVMSDVSAFEERIRKAAPGFERLPVLSNSPGGLDS